MSDQKQQEITTVIAKERSRFLQYVRHRIANISEMDAEDIVADVIFNVYNKADIHQQVENILAYMYTSIRNRIVDYLRQLPRSLSLDKTDDQTGNPLGVLLHDRGADVERIVQQEELRRQLYAAIEQLEPKQRAVWVATELEGFSFKELAERWGEPVGTLLSRKSRANKALRRLLRDLL